MIIHPEQESNQRNQLKEALSARAPAREAALLKNPPGRIAVSAEHLNIDPVQAENVPIFCLKAGALEDGWAEIGTFPPYC